MYYYLSFGSNIFPEAHAVRALRLLCREFGYVALYPFRYTDPEGVVLTARFVNALMVIYCQQDEVSVKNRLNDLEGELGRDRSDPLRSVKDRTADLDIIDHADTFDVALFKQAPERYVAMCLEQDGEKPDLTPYGLAAHDGPSTVHVDALTGEIRVVDDKFDGFKNWVKTAFPR